ncbi:uncharacterized protein LOC123532336 isoform X2 [Mercenaria mercenaria]|uniref:uncharacterized protein LOC123532336 isoform X2 n=1 Tax=Mercenaria mercenaria TaxID=6596 RepID=UPI00234F44EE|nr:uncharacterized protein LOC123532336 isoform X2 [Mercenaria mercenaria]
MERDSQEIPGFGFDPGYEPSPLPQEPTPSSNSIFGLISKVNKGILKKPQTSTSETGKEGPANDSIQQARAVAKKLSNISSQMVKQRVFQNAKTTIENIQNGIWNPPVVEENKPGSSNTAFKVPTVAPVQKYVDLSNKDPCHVKVASRSQGQNANMSTQHVAPNIYGEEKRLVAYDDADRTKHTGNFSRQEALDEIDRYRGPARGYDKDKHYEETGKKTEPFKSDFDRYYYGNENQRNEIAGKLHRTDVRDDFRFEKEFASKQFHEHSSKQGTNIGRDFKNRSDARSRGEYQSVIDNFQRPRNDNYQGSRNYNYKRPVNETYQTGNDNHLCKPFASETGHNYSVQREFSQRDEYDPERWDYGRKRECGNIDIKNSHSRGMESGSYGSKHKNEKPLTEDKIPDNSDRSAYLKDTRSRNVGLDQEQFYSRSKHSQERPESGSSGSCELPQTVYDYGDSVHTYDGEIMSYRTRRQTDELGERFDSYSNKRNNRDISRDRGSASGNRVNERDGYYEEGRQQCHSKSEMDYYSDNYYDRVRGERCDYRNEEYCEDMANMEEFPEEGEHDSKLPDGGMLYEDFLFGEEYEEEKVLNTRQNDNKGYRSRQFDNEFDRKKKVKIGMMNDEENNLSRNKLSDWRGTRGRGMEQNCDRMKSRDSFGERKVDQGFAKVGRNMPITDDEKAQVEKPADAIKVDVQAQVPPLTGVRAQVPPLPDALSSVPVQVPPTTGVQAQVPLSTGIPMQVPCLAGVQAQVPPLSGVSAPPPFIVTAVIPPPGIICKDCNVTCLDEEIYNAHLKSNMHVLTLQRKAQELFHMGSRKSRFNVDSTGKPIKASILPPTTMITVIPPKPLGPLDTRSVQCTWLILQWRTRHKDEEALIDKYVVEYRNAREIRWVRVGATAKHELEVNGLQEGTDYLFRVYTTNRDERSEYLESVLITTKKRRDTPERGQRIACREKDKGRSRKSSRESHRRPSREMDRKHGHELSRKPIRNRKITGERKRIGERKSSRDIGRVDSKQSKGRDSKPMKKTSSSDSKQNKAETNGNKEEKQQIECKSTQKKTVETSKAVEVDKPEELKQEGVECLLYKELPNYSHEPLLGLDDIYEIRSYVPKTPPRYVCKLCNNKGSHKIIVKHIIGFPHKLNYFKKHNPEIYDIINVIALKKQQVERANYEARLEEDRIGRGSVRVMLMLNPEDNNGKVVYNDPLPVKAPLPLRKKEMGEVPEAYDDSYQSQFESLYNEAIESGTLSDTTLIGLDYVKEMLHPRMEKEPRYICSLCTVLCHSTTILCHLVGKKHRFNYLKVYQEHVYDMINNSKEQKLELLVEKIKEVAEKDGPGTIKTKVARNERMWRDKASKAEEAQVQTETRVREEEDENLEEPQLEEPPREARLVQAIKFGIKKTDSQPTNVKPINVLDQEQAVPKHKEVFDWNKENNLLQSRIHNETIIKSSRKSKFLTVYSEFFKRFPVIGIQWVTEFQKQDVKQEPWYMCSMCQQKLQWKSILDHVTSNLHRLNYMKKRDYRQMYNAVYHAIKKDKLSARPLIEQYSKEIASIEHPPTEMEVMLELNINTEAFKSVAKVQENVKARAVTSSATQSASIQINIASSSLSGATVSGENTSTAVQAASESKSIVTYLSSAQAQHTQAQSIDQDLQLASQVQQHNLHTPQTGQNQIQQTVQLNSESPTLYAPQIWPPPQSGTISNMMFPPPSIHTSQAQSYQTATALPSLMPFQSATNSSTTTQLPANGAVRHFAPQYGGLVQTMPVPPYTVRQPLIPGPRHRPPLASGLRQTLLPMPYHHQMGQIASQRSDQTQLAMPVSDQQPLIQEQSPRLPVYPSLEKPISATPVLSGALPVMLSTAQHPNLQNATSNLIGQKRPPPCQIQTSAAPTESSTGSSPQQNAPYRNSDSNNLHQLSTHSQLPKTHEVIGSSESVYNKNKNNYTNDRQYFDEKRTPYAASNNDCQVFHESEHNTGHDDGTSVDGFGEIERGIKRYGRESGYNDKNKRRRNEGRMNVFRTGNKAAGPQRTYDRSRRGYNDRWDRDLRKSDGRDRRNSRSPYRSDRSSPTHVRQRDNNCVNQTDQFTRRSERMTSPYREIYNRDKHRESYPEERREQAYQSDQQIPTEDYNLPLDETKVEDLVRMYSDRVDDNYDNLMSNEAEWDDKMDKRLSGDRRDGTDYEIDIDMYYDGREAHRNEVDREKFQNCMNFDDDWNEKARRGRFDYIRTDGFGESAENEYKNVSNKYSQYSRRDSKSNQNSGDSGFIQRGHLSEKRKGKRDEIQRVDRHRDRVDKHEDYFFREEVIREREFRSSEEEWPEDFREEDLRRQRQLRKNYSERQSYSREKRHTTDTFDNRRDDNRDVPAHRQRFGDDYERMYDEPNEEDDALPDPSREEIDALLRRAVHL